MLSKRPRNGHSAGREGLDLEEGAAAIIWKLSHAVTDGIGGMILELIFRHNEPDPVLPEMRPAPEPEHLTPAALTRSAIGRLPATLTRSTFRFLESSTRALRRPREAMDRASETASSMARAVGGAGVEGSPVLSGRGMGRRFEEHQVPHSTALHCRVRGRGPGLARPRLGFQHEMLPS